MAGPVLGRLIQSSSGDAFVSANLPLLHRRTVGEAGEAEFRPGVDHSAPLVDLSGEFERQFFGDVMLFTVIDLVKLGYPEQLPAVDDVRVQVQATETGMRAHYAETRQRVLARLDELEKLFSGPDHWWNTNDGAAEICALFEQFTATLYANFGGDSRAWQLLEDEVHCETRRAAIVNALLSYRTDLQSWERVLQG